MCWVNECTMNSAWICMVSFREAHYKSLSYEFIEACLWPVFGCNWLPSNYWHCSYSVGSHFREGFKYKWLQSMISFMIFIFNTLRPRQNNSHFTDNVYKCIFFSEKVWISFKISLKFVPKFPINNIPSLVQIMAWCRPGDKPLSEPMVLSLLTNIGITRPQRVNAKNYGSI